MKPAPFRYHRAGSAAEAAAMLRELGEDARVLAGGQSLIPLMNFRLARPSHLVDLNHVDELTYIRRVNGHVCVGAVSRQSDVEHSAEVKATVPLLAEALGSVGHAPIRHRGTVVGSLAHADPAAELPTVALALDATLVVQSLTGRRTIAAADFFLGQFETATREGELVIEARFPVSGPHAGSAFCEFSRRHGDFAIAGAAVVVEVTDGKVSRAAIAMCGVSSAPVRAHDAEAALVGRLPTAEAIEEIAHLAVRQLTPSADLHADAEYRRNVARIQVRQSLTTAIQRAQRGPHS
jgi:carbon-monoxide dehydrogenase medium subunit